VTAGVGFTVKVKGKDILVKAADGSAAILVDPATVDGGINIDDRVIKAGAIAGSDKSDVLIGGYGDNSLWGGIGGRDTLIGELGVNEFYYGLGNGIDVITNADDDDVVNLLGISLDDIRTIDVSDTSTTLKFVDGGRLNIEGTDELTFNVEGNSLKLDRKSKSLK